MKIVRYQSELEGDRDLPGLTGAKNTGKKMGAARRHALLTV